MLKKLRINNHCLFRWFSTNVSFKIDNSINELIETKQIKPKKHPGILYPGKTEMPKKILDIMSELLKDQDKRTFLEDAKAFRRHLRGKYPPAEKYVYQDLYTKVQRSLQNEDTFEMSEEEYQKIIKKNHNKALSYLKSKIYHSKAVNYDERKSLLYLFGRGMQDFAVMTRVLYEIKKRDPEFTPNSIFDFGSGIGSVMWAACEMWDNNVKEYLGVDVSSDMIDLSESIIKKLHPDLKLFLRQFFPQSMQSNYDMTVSAFTLMELPDVKQRVNTLYKLWKKTKKYMIIVENGTHAGYNLVNEARDFILYSNQQLEEEKCHVFSPCPHDLKCPLAANKKCVFEAIFERLPFYGRQKKKNVLFSYVILKKEQRQDEEWPRIIAPLLHRSKHIWCQMCTPSGELQKTVFTKKKHPNLYKCVKSSDWGDRVPAQQIPEGTKEQDNN